MNTSSIPAQAANSDTLARSLFMSRMEVAMRARSSAKQAAFRRTPQAWTTPTPAVPRWRKQRFRKNTKREGLRESPCASGDPRVT
eukprot:1916562-Rhodomonas_salina.1